MVTTISENGAHAAAAATDRIPALKSPYDATGKGYLTPLQVVSGLAYVDAASATTTDIGAAASDKVRITGTTTITGLGTVTAGTQRSVRFAAALTLTHNATSLILPGAANITTAANDTAEFVSLGSGNWLCVSYKRASGFPVNDGVIKTVPTYAALTALTAATGLVDNGIYYTYARATEEDGGAGFWRYDSASTATANGGTILAIDGGGAGRFFRLDDDQSPLQTERFGALGNFSNNDRSAIQASIDALGLLGGKLNFSHGKRYLVGENGSNNYCLSITQPVSLEGQGLYCAITPDTGIASDVSTIKITPDASVTVRQLVLRNLYLGNPFTGTRAGGVGIEIDMSAVASCGYWAFENLAIEGGAGVALLVTNDDTDNVNGGFFTSQFRGGYYEGGLKFVDCGDSILVDSITTSGALYGVEWQATEDGSGNQPSQFILFNWNSTADDGQLVSHSGHFVQVKNSNVEQLVAGPTHILNWAGDVGLNRAAALVDTQAAAFAGVNATSIVRIANSRNARVEWNMLLIGSASTSATYDIQIDSTATDTYVGPNISSRSGGLSVLDNGVGTRGITKTATKENSWVDVGSGAATLQYVKTVDGMVHITGGCKNGTTTAATTIFTLPTGFRPAAEEFASVTCLDNGAWTVPAILSVASTGVVSIVYCPTAGGANAQRLQINITFRASAGNSVSFS